MYVGAAQHAKCSCGFNRDANTGRLVGQRSHVMLARRTILVGAQCLGRRVVTPMTRLSHSDREKLSSRSVIGLALRGDTRWLTPERL